MVGKGLLCVLSSPSGGGKTSVIQEILKRKPEYAVSVSATTRPRRGHEINGKDY
ncbi:MAG TPA: guanylate kinase, partial [Bacteroidetes bacterium]|nr:guanylate kinase [Bacteroidota bacterium]